MKDFLKMVSSKELGGWFFQMEVITRANGRTARWKATVNFTMLTIMQPIKVFGRTASSMDKAKSTTTL